MCKFFVVIWTFLDCSFIFATLNHRLWYTSSIHLYSILRVLLGTLDFMSLLMFYSKLATPKLHRILSNRLHTSIFVPYWIWVFFEEWVFMVLDLAIARFYF
jgi:hypothetical protein